VCCLWTGVTDRCHMPPDIWAITCSYHVETTTVVNIQQMYTGYTSIRDGQVQMVHSSQPPSQQQHSTVLTSCYGQVTTPGHLVGTPVNHTGEYESSTGGLLKSFQANQSMHKYYVQHVLLSFITIIIILIKSKLIISL